MAAADSAKVTSSEGPDSTVSMSSEKGASASAPDGGIQRIEIEPSENAGFIVTTFKKPQGKRSMSYPEPSKHAFDNWFDAESMIAKTLGVDTGESEGDQGGDSEAAPAESAAPPAESGPSGEAPAAPAGGGEEEGETAPDSESGAGE